MKEETCSGSNSLDNIETRESCPRKDIARDESHLLRPFSPLNGEQIKHIGKCAHGVFTISNFRFFALLQHYLINVPLMLIEALEWKGKEFPEIFVSCKNGQSFQLKFGCVEDCSLWYERLKEKAEIPDHLEKLFAFSYHTSCQDLVSENQPLSDNHNVGFLNLKGKMQSDFMDEYKRMGFEMDPAWKITDANSNFELCSSYPKLHIVPKLITDDKLKKISKFRASQRFPSAVWRHSKYGVVIARCSQPEVGWLYWRCEEDEFYFKALESIVNVEMKLDESLGNDSSVNHLLKKKETHIANGYLVNGGIEKHATVEELGKKVLVVDCRGNYAAFANRVKGGGSECTEYYPNCKIQFMGLANIHSVRKSFHSLRELCCKQQDQTGWLSCLEGTKWLSHISSLIKTAVVVTKAIEQERQHVVVHCSDGWDRTPQVVSLAELLLDPFYRTMKGFRILLEREWFSFGHKFADRCGHNCNDNDDLNERSPIFLQFLDCVHQLLRQFPCSFEFNETFLVKLVHHTYSCLYGTFLCNTEKERLRSNIKLHTTSIWPMLQSHSTCLNLLYNHFEKQVLYPEYQASNILLWSSLYLNTPRVYFDQYILSSGVSCDEDGSRDVCFRNQTESRRQYHRRNSDGDMKSLCNEESFNGSPGSRDDSDIYTTKYFGCKSETCLNLPRGSTLCLPDLNLDDDNSYKESSVKDNALHNCEFSENIMCNLDENNDNMENNQLLEKTADFSDSLSSSTSTYVDKVDHSCDGTVNAKILKKSEEDGLQNAYCNTETNLESNHLTTDVTDDITKNDVGTRSFVPAACLTDKLCSSVCDHYLDVDGLSLVIDPVQTRLVKLERSYREKIAKLEDLLKSQHCVCEESQKTKKDSIDSIDSTYDRHSLSSVSSNAQSDICESWEQVTDDDVRPVLWLPDHHAVRCGICDQTFNLINRKHHCRSCGGVFCGVCCSEMAPVPSEQLYDPVRVCKSCFTKLHIGITPEIVVSAS